MNHLYGPPKYYFITAGKGRGGSELTAFDNALKEAGISDYNLVKVSSIIPPLAQMRTEVDLPPGSILPIAYGAISSSNDGEIISAAIAVGLPESESVGVIMEYAGKVSEEEARAIVQRMAEEALKSRGLRISTIEIRSISTVVEGYTCVFAGVALW